jgi:hypothetical protein
MTTVGNWHTVYIDDYWYAIGQLSIDGNLSANC